MNFAQFQTLSWLQKRRWLNDAMTRYAVAIGGMGVIVAIALIFFYLLYVVAPIFSSASIEPYGSYSLPQPSLGKTLYVDVEESGQLGVRITDQGQAVFFDLNSGDVVSSQALVDNERLSQVDVISTSANILALKTVDDRFYFVKFSYPVSFSDTNQRILTPIVNYPYSNQALTLDLDGERIKNYHIRQDEDSVTLAILTRQNSLFLQHFNIEVDEEIERVDEQSTIALKRPDHERVLIDDKGFWLYVLSPGGALEIYNISDKENPVLVDEPDVIDNSKTLVTAKLLLGGNSLLIADNQGQVGQWFMVRDENNIYRLKNIRNFNLTSDAISTPKILLTESRRKGFLVLDQQSQLNIYHTTAQRHLITQSLGDQPIEKANLSPRANYLITQSTSEIINLFRIDNAHPELSWHSLWQEVWYEGYSQPEYIWQSSSADNDFEPKFSLTPLAFGTFKGALYAMLFAAPLAIMGAIYTAYFMSSGMRQVVKPSIEIMEALPTVILGFLAGLWLAPIVEESLTSVLSAFIVMPLGLIGFAFLWHCLPKHIKYLIPPGYQAALLMPVVVLLVWLSFVLGPFIEYLFFAGDTKAWILAELNIGYDQRNALVVGIAMGLAVIPTIFSIAEDAVFSVPRHLTDGSLALGATPWQTLTRVVLLTASPGIFSAVMIGFGRAIGETMIVLMATGNTPVLDMSMFQGMRTMSANIAVELPESEVDSSHYRVLFLAALVLFGITFMFNTLAEIVRQRLRERYGNL